MDHVAHKTGLKDTTIEIFNKNIGTFSDTQNAVLRKSNGPL